MPLPLIAQVEEQEKCKRVIEKYLDALASYLIIKGPAQAGGEKAQQFYDELREELAPWLENPHHEIRFETRTDPLRKGLIIEIHVRWFPCIDARGNAFESALNARLPVGIPGVTEMINFEGLHLVGQKLVSESLIAQSQSSEEWRATNWNDAFGKDPKRSKIARQHEKPVPPPIPIWRSDMSNRDFATRMRRKRGVRV